MKELKNETPDFYKEKDILGLDRPDIKVDLQNQQEYEKTPELDVVYASLSSRILAYLLDAVIILIPSLIIDLIIFGPTFYQSNNGLGLNLVHLIIWTLYYGLTESSIYQATLGKRVFNLKVIDEFGNRLSFKKASFRFLTQIISIVPLGFGIWSIATDDKKQAWHDMLLGCYVIKMNKKRKITMVAVAQLKKERNNSCNCP